MADTDQLKTTYW